MQEPYKKQSTPLFLFLFDPRSSIESKDQVNLSQIVSQALIIASCPSSHSYILKPVCFLCHVLRQSVSAICKHAIFLAHEEPRKIISLDTCSQSYVHLSLASPRSTSTRSKTTMLKTGQGKTPEHFRKQSRKAKCTAAAPPKWEVRRIEVRQHFRIYCGQSASRAAY